MREYSHLFRWFSSFMRLLQDEAVPVSSSSPSYAKLHHHVLMHCHVDCCKGACVLLAALL